MAENLIGDEEMANVRAGEPAAGCAIAFLIQRSRVDAVFGALDVDAAIDGKCGTIASHACGSHAIEQIGAALHPLHEIFGKSAAQHVPRPARREHVVHDLQHAVHVRFRFSHRKTANAKALPVRALDDGARRLPPEVLVYSALHDWKERLVAVEWIILFESSELARAAL